jgi:hypothetical protein
VYFPVEGVAPWAPEDTLDPSVYGDPSDVSRDFDSSLGAPCDTIFWDDSSAYTLVYRLSSVEFLSDSVYRRRLFMWRGDTTVTRSLTIGLFGGKKLLHHSWNLTGGDGAGRCRREPPK